MGWLFKTTREEIRSLETGDGEAEGKTCARGVMGETAMGTALDPAHAGIAVGRTEIGEGEGSVPWDAD